MKTHLIVGMMKEMLHKISYFTEPAHGKNEIKANLDLPNYATKADLKNAAGAYASDCAKKFHLASLKLDIEN